jgi:isoquinoline 1-oxidoreductase beta subunit
MTTNKTAVPAHDADAAPAQKSISRRRFLQKSMATGAGLALSFFLPAEAKAPTAAIDGDDALLASTFKPNAWLAITPDERVIFVLDRVEMGQGTMTSHAMLIAEELEINPARIEVVFAPGTGGPYNNPKLGLQLTGGSSSVAGSWNTLRQAGASAREMLRAAAAKRLDVPLGEIEAHDGLLHHRSSKRSLSYGEVSVAAARENAPKVALKMPADFKYIGKSVKRLDIDQKVMGTAQFGIDVSVPGMVNAYIVRSPVLGGTPKSFNDAGVMRAAGVIATVRLPNGVAVVAQYWYQAKKAAALLKVEWDDGAMASVSSVKIAAEYAQLLKQRGKVVRTVGNIGTGFDNAKKVIEATYDAPYLAHATMEPQNCVASVKDDACEIWAPTQWPQLAVEVSARLTGLPHAKIHVHQTFIGGGFGRRIKQDYVEEAVLVSMAIKRPVKVIWSREDDMKNDFYRPCAVNLYRAGLDEHGKVSAYFARVVTQSIVAATTKDFLSTMAPTWVPNGIKRVSASMAASAYKGMLTDDATVEGTATFAYAFPNASIEYVNADPGVPIGFWRSVGHSYNAFMSESFVDELAHAAKQDPYTFRHELLSGAPRLRRVLELAADKAGWGKPLPPNVFRGIAVAESFGSVVAHVAEVSIEQNQIRVHRVVSAVDCGLVVNPDIVKAQVEGSIVFGLSAALKGKITITDGKVDQSNFHDYDVLRIHETPKIEVHIVPSDAPPTGIGEPGLPPIAPAVANATFMATGKRLRSLPLSLA